MRNQTEALGLRLAAKLGLLVALGAALGCGRADPAGGSAAEERDPVQVQVIRPGSRSVVRVVEQPGSVRADEETDLFAKLPGFVSRVLVDIGQRVQGPRYDWFGDLIEPGQVLAEIAIPETEEEAKQKQALVGQAAAEVEQARKALLAAQAGVSAAEALVVEAKAGVGRAQALVDRWESESKRMARLARGGTVDLQARDETANQYRAAAAGRDEARARVVSAQAAVRKSQADEGKAAADVKAAQAKLEVAKAEARRLQALLEYTRVRAPYDGVVTRRQVNTGDFLQPAPGKGVGVFTVARLDPVRVSVEVPEADAALVTEKAPIKLAIPALRGAEVTARVSRTSWSLSPTARTLRAEIDLPNGDGKLRPGMYAYARLTARVPVRWALPASAVAGTGEGTFGYRVEGGKAARTGLRVGMRDGGWVEVVGKQTREGGPWEALTGREEFAARGLGELSDGRAVVVR